MFITDRDLLCDRFQNFTSPHVIYVTAANSYNVNVGEKKLTKVVSCVVTNAGVQTFSQQRLQLCDAPYG